MNAKRILSSVLFVLAICSAMAQQRVDIILKDRSIMSCPLEDISYMEIVESALPGELDGVWYLGWRIGTTTKNYNGEEMLVTIDDDDEFDDVADYFDDILTQEIDYDAEESK